MGHYGNWSGDWVAMTVMMVAFWAIVTALVVWAVHTLRPAAHAPDRILAERFARGEIDDDEYRRRRDALVGAGSSDGGRS